MYPKRVLHHTHPYGFWVSKPKEKVDLLGGPFGSAIISKFRNHVGEIFCGPTLPLPLNLLSIIVATTPTLKENLFRAKIAIEKIFIFRNYDP